MRTDLDWALEVVGGLIIWALWVGAIVMAFYCVDAAFPELLPAILGS